MFHDHAESWTTVQDIFQDTPLHEHVVCSQPTNNTACPNSTPVQELCKNNSYRESLTQHRISGGGVSCMLHYNAESWTTRWNRLCCIIVEKYELHPARSAWKNFWLNTLSNLSNFWRILDLKKSTSGYESCGGGGVNLNWLVYTFSFVLYLQFGPSNYSNDFLCFWATTTPGPITTLRKNFCSLGNYFRHTSRKFCSIGELNLKTRGKTTMVQ